MHRPARKRGPLPRANSTFPWDWNWNWCLRKTSISAPRRWGDPVYAQLTRDLKDKRKIVLPKGATATGRIVRLEKEADHSVVGIEFPEIEAPGILAHMKGYITRTCRGYSTRRRKIDPLRCPSGEAEAP